MATAFERELDRLYQLPLSEFTAARNELAKRLRAEGKTERAEEVKALKKPTVAVWLVNRLAREDEVDVQRLLKAGESLTKSQAKVAAGSSADRFVEARRAEQQALERLAREAHKIARREGIGGSAIERATQTLRAASLTDEGRRLLKRGRLSEELQPPGFEALTGLELTPPASRQQQADRKADRRNEGRRALAEARERVRRLRAEERQDLKAARAAKRKADRAEHQARKLREEADAAQADAAAAGKRVAEAERELERLK